jgi:AcrR family transcriptional regulator
MSKGRRPRNPELTRADILEAGRTLLAKNGAEALSLSEVAKIAGVNRGTAYQHFNTREELVAATIQSVSDKMFREIFGDPETLGVRDLDQVDMFAVTENLAMFAMDNPELSRIWLLQMLAMPDPMKDPFWCEYVGSIGRFAKTELAVPNIDVEVWSMISLTGYFLWPVWAQAHAQSDEERKALAHRFAKEMLRLSLFGSLSADKLPELVARLGADTTSLPRLRAVG